MILDVDEIRNADDVLLAECDKQNNETAKAAVMDYMNIL